MERSTISSWVRQARYRAKRHNIYSDVEICDIEEILEDYDNKCVYCDKEAEVLDHPFPLSQTATNIPANVLPSCKKCKARKKNNDLTWMFSSGLLKQDKYLELLQQLFNRKGGESIKRHVRKVTGLIGDQ